MSRQHLRQQQYAPAAAGTTNASTKTTHHHDQQHDLVCKADCRARRGSQPRLSKSRTRPQASSYSVALKVRQQLLNPCRHHMVRHQVATFSSVRKDFSNNCPFCSGSCVHTCGISKCLACGRSRGRHCCRSTEVARLQSTRGPAVASVERLGGGKRDQ